MRFSRLLCLAAFWAAPLAAQTTHTVTLSGMAFSPAELTINVGDTVTWDNVSGFHNVDGDTDNYPDNPEGFRSGDPASAPWTFSHTFTLAGDYGYHCEAHGLPGSGMFGTITVNATSSTEGELPAGFTLSAPYPNPFRDETALTLTVARTEAVRVAVYDALGREVAVLHDGLLQAGEGRFVWTPTTARTGVYLLRLEGATFEATRKVIHVR